MAVNLQNVTLPTGAYTPTQTQQAAVDSASEVVEDLLKTPALPTGTTISPTLQQIQTGELLATPGVSGTVAAGIPTAAVPTVTGAAAPTTTAAAAPTAYATGQYAAGQTGIAATPQATAATMSALTAPAVAEAGAITSAATVQGQLANLSGDLQTAINAGTQLPEWARGTALATHAAMAQRGMSASTMYQEALAEGLLKAALPIAQADAETYKQMIFANLSNRQQSAITNAQNYLTMDMANLSNTQQTSLSNINHRQNTILSDQAALNAAAQFNATSNNQVNEFFTGLSSNIAVQNAQRTDAMAQFNTSEANKLSAVNAGNQVAVKKANADREAGLNQFNASVQNQRDQFNTQNQQVIDQSNVAWRRATNTANTAATNATNQTNAQNKLELSNFALSALWQQWRDEAAWVQSASENAESRNHNVAMAALERAAAFDLQDSAAKNDMYKMLGKFGIALIT